MAERLTADQIVGLRARLRHGFNSPSTSLTFVDDLLATVDAQQERIDALEAERAEGVRWFVPAYRAMNGWVGPIGAESVDRDYAEKQAERLRSNDNETEIFVASRVIPPWLRQETDRG